MLEGLVAWVLNSFLGEYVENLNVDQLSIGVVSGLVELENLPVRKDALKSLDLPLEVKSGFIGQIRLAVPWRRLRSEPWVITLEKLYLVAGPLTTKQYDATKEEKAEQERKQAQLKALEEKWKAQPDAGAEGGGSWWSYGTSLASNIIENLQLEVKDVHLRYEDDVTIPGSSFACGVTIKNLSAQSTDANWVPQFVSRCAADMMHKLLDLANFSVYWDMDAALLGHLTTAELGDALERSMSQSASNGEFKEHDYILEPVSAQAKMQRNTSALPQRSTSQPRITMDLQLDKLPLTLAETQYKTMVSWTKEFRRHDRGRKYRPWRPNVSVKDSPKAWWSFAIAATLHFIRDRNRRRTWGFLIQRSRDNTAYARAYQTLLSVGERYLDGSQKEHMDKMETELTFEELKILRQVSRERWRRDVQPMESETSSPTEEPTSAVAMETKPPQEQEQQQWRLQGWFSGWSGWYSYGKGADPGGGGGMQAELAALEADQEDGDQLLQPSPRQPGEEPPTKMQKTEVDQEIMEVLADSAENNTLLKRDTVLARLHFCLQSGSFRLLGRNTAGDVNTGETNTLLELECSNVMMGLESRPRTHGAKFEISIGGLYLRDKMTKDSIMPVLVAPQHRERGGLQSRLFSGLPTLGPGRPSNFLQPGLGFASAGSHSEDQTLFELVYEKNPLHSKADYRLDIKTKPLDIVYNPTAIRRVKEFFTVKKSSSSSGSRFTPHKSELDLAGTAQTRYEELKQQTKVELKQTWDRLLQGDATVKAKRWDFNMDISAPQFLLPQDFRSDTSTVVVLDLGHLQFHNIAAGIQEEAAIDRDEDDDDFVTPSSTPPQESEETHTPEEDKEEDSKLTELAADLTETALLDKIYDKYTLNLSDLQVMVGKAKDNWKHAHNRGTSAMHVVDKFSISLQFERRLLYTTDPRWPKNTLSGTLPSLILHFSEQKIHALRRCTDMMSDSTPNTPEVPPMPQDQSERPLGEKDSWRGVHQTHSKSTISLAETTNAKGRESLAESRLVLMQFSINQVSLEVQSRGRSIAELQVAGVKANFTKRPYDTSVSFTVHSLLVADAVQTFGPDFELLVASHKNLCLDTTSGSIRDSNPSSPLSPKSPRSPGSPGSPAEPVKPGLKQSFQSVQTAVSNALQGLVSSTPDYLSPSSSLNLSGRSSRGGEVLPLAPVLDAEALIKMELDIISPACPSNTCGDNTTLNIANVQFNNLDFIANQQTLVELLGFLREISPSSNTNRKTTKPTEDRPRDSDTAEEPNAEMDAVWEVTADFHRLNVLLVRVEGPEHSLVAHKVATATLLEAKIQATMAQDLEVEGSLGGLQLLNLTQEASKHQKVFSVGVDINPSLAPLDTTVFSHVRTDMYKTAHETLLLDTAMEKAFNFTLVKPETSHHGRSYSPMFSPQPSGVLHNTYEAESPEVTLDLKMASVCYTHSAAFLVELSQYLEQFKDYMAGVENSLKSAATEVAKGLVHSKPDLVTMSLYGSTTSLDGTWKRKSVCEMEVDSEEQVVVKPSLQLKLDAVLQTPVIIIPRKPDSSEVLVAHLGRISLRNSLDANLSSTLDDSLQFGGKGAAQRRDKVYVEIRDMSMYSMDLDKQRLLQQQATRDAAAATAMGASTFSTPLPGGGVRTSYGTPILNDTVLEFTVQKTGLDENYVNTNSDGMAFTFADKDSFTQSDQNNHQSKDAEPVLQITGRVVTPLQLVLSKHVYEQILQTVDHITPPDADEPLVDDTSATLLPDISEEPDVSIEHSVSALKLDMTSSAPRDRSASSDTLESTKTEEKPLVVKGQFEMPIFQVKMTGDLGEGEQGLVDLKLQDFKVDFEKSDPYTKTIEVSLQSLLIEDLLQDANSRHRQLMVSFASDNSDAELPPFNFMSTSCPTSMIDIPLPDMPRSLPCSFTQENVFAANARKTSSATVTSLSSEEKRGERKRSASSECPCPPPPSRRRSRHCSAVADDRLVHIKVVLVDRKCPEFASKYNSTNRIIDVDFNRLDTTINLQTWVVLLDFLGMGAKVHDLDNFRKESDSSMPRSASRASNLGDVGTKNEVINTEVQLKMQSFSLVLNKPEYELARASISGFTSSVSLRDGNFAIRGELGAMSIDDQSPHGKMYRQRFTTTGSQALDFDILKYGTPDPDLLREHDIRVKLRMTSVWYVHTHRFIQELLAFCQHFLQLQDVLGRMRAASAGQKISETAFRGSRITLDIEAGAPVMLIPHSSKSTDILVINMGNLSVHNSFLFADSEGTVAHRRASHSGQGSFSANTSSDTLKGASSCVRASKSDSTFLAGSCSTLMTQSVYGSLDTPSSEYKSFGNSNAGSLNSFSTAVGGSTSGFSISSIGEKPTQTPSFRRSQSQGFTGLETLNHLPEDYKCLLDVMSIELVDIDLFSAEWRDLQDYFRNDRERDLIFSSFVVQRQSGKVLKEKCRLSLQVERNLEGDLSHAVPDLCLDGTLTSVHFSLDLEQLKLVKGLLQHNFGEPLEEFQRPMMSHLQDPKIQTVLSGEVWKSTSLTLELLNVTTELLIAHDQPEHDCPEASLARIDFIRSRLLFDSYSDGTKDVDLVSHEIKAVDTRYRDAPANARPNVFQEILRPSTDSSKVGSLQLEVHYHSTKERTVFTILLNNMRLMGILDWLLACKDFLLTGADDPFVNDDGRDGGPSPAKTVSSVAVSPGVITKRNQTVSKKVEAAFELKLNVTDTELVVVENSVDKDTNAVIVKCTAVLSYRPRHTERPLSCSLQSLEVFSCSLAAEDETALSILDPMGVTLELNGSRTSRHMTASGPSGLLDATGDKPPVLEVSFDSLNVRLSYNDLKLFMAIANSMPRQLLQAQKQAPAKNAPQAKQDAWKVSKLQDLGFKQFDCEKALLYSKGHLDDAAMWLTQNATPLSAKDHSGNQGFKVSGLEVKAGSICMCLIDDCLDADVPLAELTFTQVNLLHQLHTQREGRADFKLSGDFYNRDLSGWEPFLETWGCILTWQQGMPEENKLSMQMKAMQLGAPLNFVVTTTLLELYSKTKVKWTKDYYQKDLAKIDDVNQTSSRRRVPFIPFAVRNETGCNLWFATVTTTPNRIEMSTGSTQQGQHDTSEWRVVKPGDELPFLIEEREKIRHKHTHELKIHQLVVRVEGWQQVAPVSMDRVGVYFRQAEPDKETTSFSFMYMDKVAARIVFDVSREGSARKVVTVRSALTLHNRLEDEIEVRLMKHGAGQKVFLKHKYLASKIPLKLVNVASDDEAARGVDHKLTVPAATKTAIPLPMVHCQVFIRPRGWSLDWCKTPLAWQDVCLPGKHRDFGGVCDTRGGESATYRFCVSVYRQHFPVESKKTGSPTGEPPAHPGHMLTVLPPVRLENLLPLDMTFYLKNTDIRGSVKPGKIASLVGVDLDQPIELGVELENFHHCRELVIPPRCGDNHVRLRLYDSNNRELDLVVSLRTCIGGSLKASVQAMYWLVNKSGVPLIFKQEGTVQPGAGQFEEHELARSVTPLLFSYPDKERNSLCTMRLGKAYHKPGMGCKWCQKFLLERGVAVRELHVSNVDSRPDLVYNIGIEVRQGRARYRHTNIVTFAPRYQLDNRSKYKLAFAQRHSAIRGQPLRPGEFLSALPDCKLSFHWPRVDLDQLLCVRIMDDPDCEWSGGFFTCKVDSFHINMRGKNNVSLFLRVDIVLQGATFFIVFTDADNMPPPYRIDNFSEVPIQYYQTNVSDESLRTAIKPGTSVPYAWDDLIFPPHLTLSVQGGSSATYNMNVVSDGKELYYENFIYIAFTATFKGSGGVTASAQTWDSYKNFVERQELVLDVAHPDKVVLKKKEPGKRTQLWRMTSTGMLEHEGSTAPRDPRKQLGGSRGTAYVLDIYDIALQPGSEQLLTLRKPDERRRTSQQFVFTEDGRLCCQSSTRLCVQPKDGTFGLRDGGEAVIGPAHPDLLNQREVPPEMAIRQRKMRPGSGWLTVKVITDGPTRVLQVVDLAHQQQRPAVRDGAGQWLVVDDKALPRSGSIEEAEEAQEEEGEHRLQHLEVQVMLPGLGVSLVSHGPQELVYITLSDITLDYSSDEHGQLVEASVKNIQVDNQLFGHSRRCCLFVTPRKADSEAAAMPALHISTHKLPSDDKWNADIYKHLMVTIKRMTLQIEERLLWKLLQFVGFNQSDTSLEDLDENSFDSQRTLTAATSAQFKRYYFGTLKINTNCIILSMLTADNLPPDLVAIKRSVGFPLIRFEEAKVELDPFIQVHPFETQAFLLESLHLHYTEELKSQAAKILGAVDFLGNPLGLFNDVTEGISGLLKDGNVGGLLTNLMHGVSDSTGKVAGSLSDSVGKVSLDKSHQKKRQDIREQAQSSTDHLVAGVKGLGHGVYGGITGVFTQTYTGARDDGLGGLFKGLGKGILGTVTKPIGGVLDLASEAATAASEASKGVSRIQPPRVRPPRCCHGPGGLLPTYSKEHAEAQEFLFSHNHNDYAEMFIAIEQLRFGEDSMQVLISNQQLHFLNLVRSSVTSQDSTMVLQVPYDKLIRCSPVEKEGGKFYLEIVRKPDSDRSSSDSWQTSHVRCDSNGIAKKVAQEINYAKTLYDEGQQTLPSDTKSPVQR